MKTKKMIATLVVALLSVTAVMAKDFRTVVFKVAQMECANCERKVKNNIKFEKGLKNFTTDLKERTVTNEHCSLPHCLLDSIYNNRL